MQDIDAVFGVIWTKVMSNNVLSPQDYLKILESVGRSKEKKVQVRDIWSVPDYKEYLNDYINKDLSRYAKSTWSQLQIIFEVADMSESCPLGVKVSRCLIATVELYYKFNVIL